jgi:AcrR family transcriptional regulator
MSKRRTRDEIVRDNREALLAAAQEMFERLGYHRASVDAIAEAAGLSKGAVYSQFGSKDELILAVIERNATVRRDALARSGQSAGDALELIRLAFGQTSSSLAWQAAVIEFRVHASRDEALSRRYAALHRRTIEGMTQLFEELSDRTAAGPARSPAQLAQVSVVVSAGLVVEMLADPTLDIEPAVEAIAALADLRLTTADAK